MTVFMKYVITIRGERELWLDFVHRVKKDKKKVWEVLSLFLRKYATSDEETRILLILFPRELVEELLTKEDPDKFIEEAIKDRLDSEK